MKLPNCPCRSTVTGLSQWWWKAQVWIFRPCWVQWCRRWSPTRGDNGRSSFPNSWAPSGRSAAIWPFQVMELVGNGDFWREEWIPAGGTANSGKIDGDGDGFWPRLFKASNGDVPVMFLRRWWWGCDGRLLIFKLLSWSAGEVAGIGSWSRVKDAGFSVGSGSKPGLSLSFSFSLSPSLSPFFSIYRTHPFVF